MIVRLRMTVWDLKLKIWRLENNQLWKSLLEMPRMCHISMNRKRTIWGIRMITVDLNCNKDLKRKRTHSLLYMKTRKIRWETLINLKLRHYKRRSMSWQHKLRFWLILMLTYKMISPDLDKINRRVNKINKRREINI